MPNFKVITTVCIFNLKQWLTVELIGHTCGFQCARNIFGSVIRSIEGAQVGQRSERDRHWRGVRVWKVLQLTWKRLRPSCNPRLYFTTASIGRCWWLHFKHAPKPPPDSLDTLWVDSKPCTGRSAWLRWVLLLGPWRCSNCNFFLSRCWMSEVKTEWHDQWLLLGEVERDV